MVQKYGCVALAALAVGVGCMTPAEAAYSPKLKSKSGNSFTKEVQGVVSYLKSLPKSVRWTFMAERLGFLFIPPNGKSGHNEYDQGWILEGSHFIGVDGVEYDALTEYNSCADHDEWNANSEKVDRLGREYVFAKLSREVTALVLKNAKYQLDSMAKEQPERRDMYLAYLAKLCYLPDGKSPNEQEITRMGPHKKNINFCDYDDKGYKFVDTEGVEHDFDEVNKKAASMGGDRWMILNVCTYHVGKKDILALFPEEVKKLRANYKKRLKELQDGTSEKQPAEDKTSNSKQEKPGEQQSGVPTVLAKKVGANYQPVDLSKESEENEETIRSVVEYLQGLPNSLRWDFIAEKLGLLFMPQDADYGQQGNSWAKPGAHFIGADGIEYDSQSELSTRAQKDIVAWGENLNKVGQLGKDVVFVRLSAEVAEFVLQNAKYHLDKWAVERPDQRELFLAYLAGLCYMPNGSNAYGKETQRAWYNLRPISITPLEPHCRFMDTAGVEQKHDALNKKYESYSGARWMLLSACAHYVGKDAIMALYPKEIKALRANYKKRMAELAQLKKEVPLVLSKSLGVKYRPQASLDNMGGQFMKNVQEVISFLQSLPNTQRWFFIAERMGLLFMPQDGATGYNPGHGWAMEHSHFIGADGVDYEYNTVMQDSPSTWVSNSDAADRLGGRAVVFSQLPDETAEILLQNAKYQIEMLEKELPAAKDAILAQLAQLGYSSGGKLSYKLRKWNTSNTAFEEYLPDIADTNDIRFVDRNGKEQFHVKDAYSKIARGRWQVVVICAYHLGNEAILALYPEDVKKLRANYEKKMAELKK